MVGNFAELKSQFLQLSEGLSRKAKIIIGVSTIIAFLGLLILVNWASRPDYTVLFNNLSSKDAGNIVNILEEKQTNYQLEDNGSKVLVPKSKVHKLRLDLASEGLPSGGVTGFEIFDQTQIGSTNFEQQVNYHRALSGELTRTIQQMGNVSYAKVQVTPSKDSIYKDKAKPAKASVMLRLDQYKQLETSQVRSIANLVASSVEGLSPDKVTIVDTAGNLLSAELEKNQQDGSGFSNNLEMKEKFESNMEEDLNVMLTKVLGLDNFVIKVNANLNFDQRSIESEEYEPVVGDKGIVRSKQSQEQSQEGSTTNPEGVPGTTSNLPQYRVDNQEQQKSESEEEVVNYEINRKVEQYTKAPGTIDRLSVAVMVNDDLGQQEQEQIEQAISSAVGYNQERGDDITITGMQFDDSIAQATDRAEQSAAAAQQQRFYLIIAGIVALLGLIIFLYRKTKSTNQSQVPQGVDYSVDDAESEQAATSELSEEEQAKREMQEELRQLAQDQPEEIAELLRSWMAED
jgi:flagellar M-ring protein FliF